MGEPLAHFLKRREASWRRILSAPKLKKPRSAGEMEEQWRDMERLAADVSYVRSRYLFHREMQHLYSAYRRALPSFFRTGYSDESAGLYEGPGGSLGLRKHGTVRSFIRARCFSHHRTVLIVRQWFILSLAVFLLSCAAGYSVVNVYSPYGEVFLPPHIRQSLESGQLWTNMLNDSPVSGGMAIILNNIMVALRSFAYGIFLGIPSLVVLVFNGWHLGSIFAGTHTYGMALNLAQFVMPHGFMELTVIIFSCSLGMHLGLSTLTMPKGTRLDYFTSMFWRSLNSVIIASLWLAVCGIIESQVSPGLAMPDSHGLVIPLSLCIGIAVLFIYYKLHHGVFKNDR